MKLYKKYTDTVSGISRNGRAAIILLLTMITFNFVILPLFSSSEAPKPLDVRYIYSSSDAAAYANALSERDRLLQIVMHLSADIVYPLVYTLFMGSLLAGSRLVVFPLILFFSDILENLLIVAVLSVPDSTALFNFASGVVPYATGTKWTLVIINIILIIFYRIFRYKRRKR